MMKRGIIPVLIGLICLLPPQLQAATPRPKVLCAKKTGALVVKNRCKRTEQKLSLDILVSTGVSIKGGNSGPKGTPGDPGIVGVQGPIGAHGLQGQLGKRGTIDFSACRLVADVDLNFDFPALGLLSATPSCDSSHEFLLEYGFKIEPETQLSNGAGTRGFLQSEAMMYNIGSNGENLPYMIDVTADRAIIGGTGAFRVTAIAACCPR